MTGQQPQAQERPAILLYRQKPPHRPEQMNGNRGFDTEQAAERMQDRTPKQPPAESLN